MLKFLLPLMLLTTATAAAAAPMCDGQLLTMRVSKLKPGGSMAGFTEAFKGNAGWYKAKGLPDQFSMAPLMLPSDGAMKPSVDQIVTFHINSPKAPDHKGDAAWDAFVAKYKENSSIESETRTCLPKGTMLVIR